ncbi:MAG TPA: impB/mucB/samB family protein [Micavibrio sp.]|nr:impB/mucB/samB family protein [Micavibrio sp.]
MVLHTPEELGLNTLFLDLNSYFASVEQNERPELRGRPVAVVPMMTDATCAIAASYEAKAYGVKTGTKIYDARRMCPNLVCVLARHDKYVEYHHRILKAAGEHIPVTKVWSIDEFHCDLMGREKIPENARALAQRIKRQIWRDAGPAINCSIGIAPNSFLAKVASDLKKPDGLVLLRPEDLPGPLFSLKLTDLPGINARMEERLLRANIRSIDDLWRTTPKQARAIWGSVGGERFWYWLRGYDVPHLKTNSVMIGHSRVLDPELRMPEKARLMARRLLFKAALRLRRKGFHAGALSLGVRCLDGRRWGGDARFFAAHDFFTFMQHLDDLWGQMTREFFGRTPQRMPNRIAFKKVSVILHDLQESGAMTGDLFQSGIAKTKEQVSKRESLTAAIEALNRKYHQDAVSLGLVPQTLAGHVGTKIAFSRVPDREEFLD